MVQNHHTELHEADAPPSKPTVEAATFSTLLRKGEGGFAETDSGCSRQHYIHKTLGSISHIFSRIVELAVKPYTALKLDRAITYLKHLRGGRFISLGHALEQLIGRDDKFAVRPEPRL